jgi:hypothetical protein
MSRHEKQTPAADFPNWGHEKIFVAGNLAAFLRIDLADFSVLAKNGTFASRRVFAAPSGFSQINGCMHV